MTFREECGGITVHQVTIPAVDKLKTLLGAKQYLKPGVSFATLDQIALGISDNQAADQLQKARQKLFKAIHGRELLTG